MFKSSTIVISKENLGEVEIIDGELYSVEVKNWGDLSEVYYLHINTWLDYSEWSLLFSGACGDEFEGRRCPWEPSSEIIELVKEHIQKFISQ